MRLVTCNIRYGLGRDGRLDLARIARTVAAADMIALQEVERFRQRSGMTDQPAELAPHLPDHHRVYGANLDIDADYRAPRPAGSAPPAVRHDDPRPPGHPRPGTGRRRRLVRWPSGSRYRLDRRGDAADAAGLGPPDRVARARCRVRIRRQCRGLWFLAARSGAPDRFAAPAAAPPEGGGLGGSARGPSARGGRRLSLGCGYRRE